MKGRIWCRHCGSWCPTDVNLLCDPCLDKSNAAVLKRLAAP